MVVKLSVNGVEVHALVDTGAIKTIIPRSKAERCGIYEKRKEYVVKLDVRGVNVVSKLKDYIPEVILKFKEKNVYINSAIMETREF